LAIQEIALKLDHDRVRFGVFSATQRLHTEVKVKLLSRDQRASLCKCLFSILGGKKGSKKDSLLFREKRNKCKIDNDTITSDPSKG